MDDWLAGDLQTIGKAKDTDLLEPEWRERLVQTAHPEYRDLVYEWITPLLLDAVKQVYSKYKRIAEDVAYIWQRKSTSINGEEDKIAIVKDVVSAPVAEREQILTNGLFLQCSNENP